MCTSKPRVKRPSISEAIVHGKVCIHPTYDNEGQPLGPCNKEIVPEVVGKLTFGMQHRYLCKDHEYAVHYQRRRVH